MVEKSSKKSAILQSEYSDIIDVKWSCITQGFGGQGRSSFTRP